MIEINNLTPEKIDVGFFKKVAGAVLKGEKKKGDLSVVLVNIKKMRAINKKYRKKDKTTDVLSFSFINSRINNHQTIGEIVICPEVVKKNAKKFDLDYNRELARVLIHGILHIIGHDHRKKEETEKMEQKERYYLLKIRN